MSKEMHKLILDYGKRNESILSGFHEWACSSILRGKELWQEFFVVRRGNNQPSQGLVLSHRCQ
jgi:hypothetical protein